MLPSIGERALGVGYLVGTGLGLIAGLFGFFLLTVETVTVALVGTTAALQLTAPLPIVGSWLHRGPLPDESGWRIAACSAPGTGVSTALSAAVLVELVADEIEPVVRGGVAERGTAVVR